MLNTLAKIKLKREVKLFVVSIAHASQNKESLNSKELKKIAKSICVTYLIVDNPILAITPLGKISSIMVFGLKHAVQAALKQPEHVRYLCTGILDEYSKPNSEFSKKQVDNMVYKIMCWQSNKENKVLKKSLSAGVLTIELLNQYDYGVVSDVSGMIDFSDLF